MSYTRDQVWGTDLNQIDQAASLQSTGDIIEISIRERKDTIQTGAIKLTYKYIFDEYPYVNNFELTAEGYLKKIDDKFVTNNNYEIAGFQFVGRINI